MFFDQHRQSTQKATRDSGFAWSKAQKGTGAKKRAGRRTSPSSKTTVYGRPSPKGTGPCTVKYSQDSESGSGHIQDETNKTKKSGRSVYGPMEKVSPDDCRSSVLSTTRRTKALEWDHHDRWDLLFLAPPIQTKTKKTKTKKPETPIEIVTLSSLGPTATYSRTRDYGTHGDTVWIEQGPLTIIAVDPGHATLVDAVRYHPDGVHVKPLPIDASRRQKRRHHLQQKLGSNDPK
jgi:hypothetical protein